jgi:outer membrane protein OmpA-like peptidoglycan-associated protein
MKRRYGIALAAAAMMLLAACSSTPERVEALETARAVVPQVEASPRAGVAATYIAEARKALNRANRLAEEGGEVADIEYEADVAAKNAQIANEKILTAQARDEIEKGTAERQAVLIEARERKTKGLEQELADLKAKQTERGTVVTLGDVLFDTGKASLKPGAYTTIDRLAEVLNRDPKRQVLIEGHTDSVGSEEFNQSLSERRAAAVQAALFERGVSSEQVRALGKGETTPVASNDDPGGRQQNRRVEMIFADDKSRTASDVD